MKYEYSDTDFKLQCALNALGYDCGKEDGLHGLGTQGGIEYLIAQDPEKYEGLSNFALLEAIKEQVAVRTEELITRYRNGEELSVDEIKNLQRGLHVEGIDTGRIDGDLGPKTKNAIAKYQGERLDLDLPSLNGITFVPEEPALPTAEQEPKWTIAVQQTRTNTVGSEHTHAEVDVIVISPEGEKHVFKARSGGRGDEKDDSMLPGLDRDLNGEGTKITIDGKEVETFADYKIDYSKPNGFVTNITNDAVSDELKNSEGVYSWLRLGSYADQTDRGEQLENANNPNRNSFFAFHQDGGAIGTKGCIGFIDDENTQKFFELVKSIPEAQRPKDVVVLSPEIISQAANSDEVKAPTAHAQNANAESKGTTLT